MGQRIDAHYIECCKQDQQHDQTNAQVIDILRLQPFNNQGLIDPFINDVYTVCNHLIFEEDLEARTRKKT